MGTEATTLANLVVKDSFERSATPPQISETEHDCTSRHDKSRCPQVLNYEHQRIHCHHTHREKSFDHKIIKHQELRPLILAPLKSVTLSGETGFACKGPAPAPPDPWTAPLPLIMQWGAAHHTQEPLIAQHLSPYKLKFLPLEFSHPKTHCRPDFQQCATTEESSLETATNAAESNLGATTEQMSLAEIAKYVPSAESPGCWLKKSGLS